MKATIVLLICLLPVVLFSQVPLVQFLRFDIPYGRYFIRNVSANGDINGDGTNDLIYGCCQSTDASGGLVRVYVYHGLPANSNAPPNQIIDYPNLPHISSFGNSISYSGDLNGDGINDLVIGSYGSGETNAGAVHIYYGGTTLNQQPDLTLYGQNYVTNGDWWTLLFGERIFTDCDFNGDGYDDLLVYGSGPQMDFFGNVFVFFGGPQLDTNCALHLEGTNFNEHLGSMMSTGDINGDGFDDIVLVRKLPVENSIYNYYYIIDVYAGGSNLSNVPVYETYMGNTSESTIAFNLLANGDLNGDGFDDISMAYDDSLGSSLKVIYGNSAFDALTVQRFDFLSDDHKHPQFYCDFNHDQYIDFCMFQYTAGVCSGSFNVYKQTSPIPDLTCDYANIGWLNTSNYGQGYLLGDISHDGYPEFFVYSRDGNGSINYGTVLSEQYTDSDDATNSLPTKNIVCFPNPFNKSITINNPYKSTGAQYDIKIYDTKGRMVYMTTSIRSQSITISPFASENRSYSSGIYLLRMTEKGRVIATSKLLYIK